MKKAYFQYYETFENILKKIKDIEEREHMRKTIINYGLYGTLPAGLSELEEMAWTICKDLIDQQYHRREVNAANRAKYGDLVIDHPFNVGYTCCLKCNGALDISRNPAECIKLCKRIYTREALKYEGTK